MNCQPSQSLKEYSCGLQKNTLFLQCRRLNLGLSKVVRSSSTELLAQPEDIQILTDANTNIEHYISLENLKRNLVKGHEITENLLC
jgi:hypothetical protein